MLETSYSYLWALHTITCIYMVKNLYIRIHVPLLLCLLAISMSSCYTPDDLKNDADDPAFIESGLVSYDGDNPVIPGQYIILLKEEEEGDIDLVPDLEGERLQRSSGGGQIIYKALDISLQRGQHIFKRNGLDQSKVNQAFADDGSTFMAELTEKEVQKLMDDPDVEIVEEDRLIALSLEPLIRTPFIPSDENTGGKGNVPNAKKDGDGDFETYGVERLGGSVNFENSEYWKDRFVWIVDSGIDTDHPDLNIVHAYSESFVGRTSYEDFHGHGTHVAGIVAAKDNGFGTVGVAAGARVVAIKVLDDKGKGKVSSIISALYYIKRHSLPNDVVNISVGGKSSRAITRLVKRLGRRGVHVVCAAGNKGKDVRETSPANVNGINVYTVGAIDWNDIYTDYSNYGDGLDLAAPGEGILSTHLDGKYAYMSGTSMAAPHAAGVMVLTEGFYNTSGQTWAHNRYLNVVSR